MRQAVEDALWRKYRREKRSMTEWNALLGAIRDEAHKRGWSVFLDERTDDHPKSYLIKLFDTRGATFRFPYDDIVTERQQHENRNAR
jgi:hypothetical protein